MLIAVVAIFSYSNTFQASFNFDDLDSILNNTLVKNRHASLWEILVSSRRAIGQLSFVMNYRIGGTNVLGYHIVNLSIHILTASLLYFLVIVTCQSVHRRYTATSVAPPLIFRYQSIAVFSALLFVAHPVQTQAVTYIVQRFTSLCTLFYLAAILCYALARRNAEECSIENSPTRLRVWGYIIASLVCAILAVKTKEIAFTFPVMVLVYEFMFFHTDFKQRLNYLLLPVAVPFIVLCIMVVQAIRINGFMGLREFTQAQTSMPRIDYLFTQFRVISTYIRLIFLPVNQSVDYDYRIFTSFTWEVALSALMLGLIFLTAIWLWIRSNQIPPTPDTLYLRLMAFGVIWFFVTLSIESSIIPIVDVIFEHRLYLPLSGVMITITSAILYGASRLEYRKFTKPAITFLFLAITLILAIATYKRNTFWASDLTLWQDAYRKAPHKSRVANNYASVLISRGKGEAALPLLIASIEREPGYFAAWNNLPRVFDQIPFLKGHYKNGFEMLDKSGDVNPVYVSKWFSIALNNLGVAYLLQNDIPKAFDNYRKSLEINPSFSLARENAMSLISALPDRTQASHYTEQLPKMPNQ